MIDSLSEDAGSFSTPSLDEVSDLPITRDDVQGRRHALEAAERNPREALKIARKIRHPWYRCQALSAVGGAWDGKVETIEILEEALCVAKEQSEPNRIVSVSRWPLQVMSEVSPQKAAIFVPELVSLANTEPHTLRRADALYSLAIAFESLPDVRALIVPSLVSSLLAGVGWRIDRLIRWTCESKGWLSDAEVHMLASHHSDGRAKRAFLARIGQLV